MATRTTTVIRMYRGDSYPITLTLTDANTKLPIDLTGCSLVMTWDTLQDPPDTTTKVAEIAGVLVAPPTNGKVTFTPATTDTATVGTYYYDVQLTDADSNIRTVIKSTVTVSQDITK